MRRRLLGTISVALAFTGCAHGPLGALPVVDSGRAAELVIIRPGVFVGCGTSSRIVLDGEKVFALGCHEHVILPVPEGERILGVAYRTWFVEDVNTTVVTTAAGRRYYFRLDPGYGSPLLNRIPAAEGEKLVGATERAI